MAPAVHFVADLDSAKAKGVFGCRIFSCSSIGTRLTLEIFVNQPYVAEDFCRMALVEFPELREEFEYNEGLLHVQMGAFAQRLQEAKGTADWDAYARGVRLAHELWQRPDEALLNALNVSFLEHLDFTGPRGPHAWGLLTPELQHGWRAMQKYLSDLAALPKKKRKGK
jgi:hypothetical protein